MASTINNRQDVADLVVVRLSRVAAGLDVPENAVIRDVVEDAANWFSRHKPRHVVDTTLDGDGSAKRFLLTSLGTTWVTGVSAIQAIEHPVKSDPDPPEFLDESEWDLYPNRDAPTHIIFDDAPAAGTNNIGVHYTTVHAVSDTTISLDEPDRPALVYLTACLVARIYETRYAHTTDATIEADATDYQTKSERWGAIAESMCKTASKIAGVDFTGAAGGEGGVASTIAKRVDVDPTGVYQDPIWRLRSQR